MREKNEHQASQNYKWLYILIAFYGFEYVRFQDSFFPFLLPLSIPMLLTLILTGYVFLNFKKITIDKSLVCVLLLWILILVWVPFATNNFHAFHTAKSMSMILLSCFATILIVDTREKFLILLNALIFYFFLVAIWIMYSGGRGTGGFVADENDAALLMVSALPLAFYRIFHARSRKFRIFLVFAICSILLATIFTYSRGGLVGLVAVISFMIWISKKRWKNVSIAFLLVFCAGGVILTMLPADYVDDMSTINDKEDDTRNLRLLHWTTAIEMFKDNPIFGVGPNNYPWTSNKYLDLSPYFKEGARFRSGRQSHSLYFTLIPELGLVGVILFLVLLSTYRAKSIEIIRRSSDEEDRVIAKSLYASLAGFLVTAIFISVLYYPILWHLTFLNLAFYKIKSDDFLLLNKRGRNDGSERKKTNFVTNSRA